MHEQQITEKTLLAEKKKLEDLLEKKEKEKEMAERERNRVFKEALAQRESQLLESMQAHIALAQAE